MHYLSKETFFYSKCEERQRLMGNPSELRGSNFRTKVYETVLLVLASVGFVANIIINVFAAGSVGDIANFGFKNEIGVYRTQVIPASWTFSIWGLIYAWQVLWLLHR